MSTITSVARKRVTDEQWQTRHRPRSVTLQGGASVAYWEFGAPSGTPLVAMHGMPICGLCFAPLDAVAKAMGVRVLGPDRPGFGRSTPRPQYTVAGWVDTLCEFADLLGIDRFGVLGWSSGGPYGLACGARCPERVLGLAVVGSILPIANGGELAYYMDGDREIFALARNDPDGAIAKIHDLVRATRTTRESALATFTEGLSARERALVLSLGPLDEAFAYFPATECGPQGFADGIVSVTQPWGFELRDVATPVHIFVGDADNVVSPAAATALANELRSVRVTTLANEGHLLVYTNAEKVITAAVGA